MRQEQRLLLTFLCMVGIVALWTALFPSPKVTAPESSPIETRSSPAAFSELPPAAEEVQTFSLGSVQLGIGAKSGHVQTLQVGDVDLLSHSGPGFLQIEVMEPAVGPLEFKTAQEGSVILSRASDVRHGVEIIREISLPDKRQEFLLKSSLIVENKSSESHLYQVRLFAYKSIQAPDSTEQRYTEGFISLDGKPHSLRTRVGHPLQFQGTPQWVTSQGRSHALVIRPGTTVPPGGVFHVEHSADNTSFGWLELPAVKISSGSRVQWDFDLYAGTLKMAYLKAAGMEEAISFGVFSGITKILLDLLTWSKGWLHNYGLAILFLSIAIWLPFFPLTWIGIRANYKTMEKMAVIRPKEARIRKENRGNPQKMNQELLELYRKEGVNPASGFIGCLPFFFQAPIYFALFQVLNRAPQLRGEKFLFIRDLSMPDTLIRFPSRVPFFGEGIHILPVIAAIAMYFQQNMMQRPQAAATEEEMMQRQIFKFMPIMFCLFFYNLPAGFLLYFLTNTSLTLAQYLLVKRAHQT